MTCSKNNKQDNPIRDKLINKEQEHHRTSKDFIGRQALLLVRDYFRESRNDRQHTDKLKVKGIKLHGGTIGY